jgi:hypothetical protein
MMVVQPGSFSETWRRALFLKTFSGLWGMNFII